MRFRAFIAADIVPSESLVAVLGELARSRADLKIVRPELMHVTLKFLGDTEEDIVDDIVECMRKATSGVQPFKVKLSGMGAFPSLSNIRVIWVGMEDGSVLGKMAEDLDTLLRGLGFERDRKGFKPHLTVARARSGRNIANVQEILKSNPATDYGTYSFDRIVLKKSVLGPTGPSYSTVKEVMLG